MADKSGIEWTDATWNPVTGCTKISPGCKNCYAERLAHRLQAMGTHRYRNAFKLTLQADQIELPLKWKQPRKIFVNSMSDLFHKDVPVEYIQKVFAVMQKARWHVFQILTKRADRVEKVVAQLPWPKNVWQGVSVENQAYVSRIEHLRNVPAAVRFVSVEPLIGPIQGLPLEGIHWVIVGGESGPNRRPIKEEWVLEIKDQCLKAGTGFFFKQWGGRTPKAGGRVLQGRVWDEMPSNLTLMPQYS